jgi:hypothetical protein
LGQTYHSLSLRLQQMGALEQPFSNFSVSPRYSAGTSRFQAQFAVEIPAQSLASNTEWAGQKLRPMEKVGIKRWVGKFRLKSQPEAGSLGLIYAAVNYYNLEVKYQNLAVFGEAASQFRLNIGTFGLGLFEFWEIDQNWLHLLGAEMLILSDTKTVELWLEMKALLPKNIQIGLNLETLQPKPRLTDLYFGVYAEYAWRW